MSTQYYFKTISKFLPLTRKEERALFIKAKAGDRAAYEKIIQSNLRFVVSISKAYVGKGLDLEDLISEGNIGLLKAYNGFDINKNFKFITYAVWWIRQSILLAIQNYGKTIRMPANKLNGMSKALKAKTELEQKFGHKIDLQNLDEYIDDDYILDGARYHMTVLDFEEPLNDSGIALRDTIPVENGNEFSLDIFLEELTDLIKDFPEREKDIIYMYYGIDQEYPYTLTEIGDKIGLTRERIRQIKEKTLEKIKKKEKSKDLLDFIND